MREDEGLDFLHFRDTGQFLIGRGNMSIVAVCETIHIWEWNLFRRLGIDCPQMSEFNYLWARLVYSVLTYISKNPEIQDPILNFQNEIFAECDSENEYEIYNSKVMKFRVNVKTTYIIPKVIPKVKQCEISKRDLQNNEWSISNYTFQNKQIICQARWY